MDVFWTEQALSQLIRIKTYLIQNFTKREAEKLAKLIAEFESTIERFPKLYQRSLDYHHLRRAVLNKFLSVIYTIEKDKIIILSILDNRQDHNIE